MHSLNERYAILKVFTDGEYTSHAQIVQLINLLGPPPKELSVRESTGRDFNSDGRCTLFPDPSRSLKELDHRGEFKAQCHVRPRRLVDTVSAIEGEERSTFLALSVPCLNCFRKNEQLRRSWWMTLGCAASKTNEPPVFVPWVGRLPKEKSVQKRFPGCFINHRTCSNFTQLVVWRSRHSNSHISEPQPRKIG